MSKGIFIESSEELGLLYNRYHKIPQKVDKFIGYLEDQVDRIRKDGVNWASEFNDELKDKIAEFKKDIIIDIKEPDEIYSDEIKEEKNKVKTCRKYVETLLTRLGKLRHSVKYGDHYLNGILFRPKVLHHETDPEMHEKTNVAVRTITRGLDWAEKIVLDLLNLTSQDENILSLISTVYYRNIFENGELDIDLDDNDSEENDDDDIMNEPIDDDNDVEIDDEDELDPDDIMTMRLGSDDEEFYPIFVVTMTAGDREKSDDSKIKSIKNTGKMISAVTLGEKYTHSEVGFDPSMKHMYSFNIDQKFHETDLTTDTETTICTADSIYVAVAFLREDEVDAVKQAIIDYDHNQHESHYNVKQLIAQIFGKADHVNYSHICSTFVGYLLNIANPKNIHRDYSMIRPEDITLFPRSFHVITFRSQADLRDRVDEIQSRVKKIYQDNIDEIREYNNELPKILIRHHMKQDKGINKLFNALANKFT